MAKVKSVGGSTTILAIVSVITAVILSICCVGSNAYADEATSNDDACLQIENCEDETDDVGISLYASSANVSSKFGDVDSGQWYTEYIQWAYDNDIMCGYNSSRWGTNDPITRADFVTVLWRWYAPEEYSRYVAWDNYNKTGLFDIEDQQYWTGAANWAVQTGVVTGKKTSNFYYFDPYASITREEMVTILYRLAGSPSFYSEGGFNGLPDYGEVSSYAYDAMRWAYNYKIITGAQHADGTYWLEPQRAATRAETAKLFDKGQEKIRNAVQDTREESQRSCLTYSRCDCSSISRNTACTISSAAWRVSSVSTAYVCTVIPNSGYNLVCVRAKAYLYYEDVPSLSPESEDWDLDVYYNFDDNFYAMDFPSNKINYSTILVYYNFTTSDNTDILRNAYYALAHDSIFSNQVDFINFCVTGEQGDNGVISYRPEAYSGFNIGSWEAPSSFEGIEPGYIVCYGIYPISYTFGVYVGNNYYLCCQNGTVNRFSGVSSLSASDFRIPPS